MNVNTQVYTTVTALGADSVYSASTGMVYLKGFAPMLAKGIRSDSKVVAPVTGVAQVTTLTPTASQNSTQFGISVTFCNKATGVVQTRQFYYTSDATMTVTEVCDAFRAQINNLSNIMPITATGTTTLILTASTTYAAWYQFSVSNISTCAGVWTSITTGTAAVIPVGRGIDIKAGGQIDEVAAALIVDASYYGQAIINYDNDSPGGSAQTPTSLVQRNILYVLAGASTATVTTSNYITLLGTYGTLTQAMVGKSATWILQTNAGTHTYASGALTLVGGDVFYGATPTCPLLSGDVLSASASGAATSAGYVVLSGIKDADEGYSASADVTFAANVAQYVQLRDISV